MAESAPAASDAPAAAGTPAASATTTTQEIVEATEVNELKELIGRPTKTRAVTRAQRAKTQRSPKRRPAKMLSQRPLPAWDSSPHRPEPSALRGLKAEREPWYADEQGWFSDAMVGNGAIARIRKAHEVRERQDQVAQGSDSEDTAANLKASLSLKPRVATLKPGSPRRSPDTYWTSVGRDNGTTTFQ